MKPLYAAITVIIATVGVAVGLWWLHPALTVIYVGTIVQIGALLLVPVEVGGLKR